MICTHGWDPLDCAFCQARGRAPAKHYVDEWERHPDLFAFEITANDTHYAALCVAAKVAARFEFPLPIVRKDCKRQQTCECLGTWEPPRAFGSGKWHCRITLCANFSAGQLLHELAHAWCFSRYGDHDHGTLFRSAMDDICFWFRLDEEAQGWLFP